MSVDNSPESRETTAIQEIENKHNTILFLIAAMASSIKFTSSSMANSPATYKFWSSIAIKHELKSVQHSPVSTDLKDGCLATT